MLYVVLLEGLWILRFGCGGGGGSMFLMDVAGA